MVLGTADEAGRPWVSPVYFAVSDYTDFYWVSLPDARHSRNLASRPEVSIVVFDSSVPIGTGQGVYMTARAEELAGSELERGIEVFSRKNPGARRKALERGRRASSRASSSLSRVGDPALDARSDREARRSPDAGDSVEAGKSGNSREDLWRLPRWFL